MLTTSHDLDLDLVNLKLDAYGDGLDDYSRGFVAGCDHEADRVERYPSRYVRSLEERVALLQRRLDLVCKLSAALVTVTIVGLLVCVALTAIPM